MSNNQSRKKNLLNIRQRKTCQTVFTGYPRTSGPPALPEQSLLPAPFSTLFSALAFCKKSFCVCCCLFDLAAVSSQTVSTLIHGCALPGNRLTPCLVTIGLVSFRSQERIPHRSAESQFRLLSSMPAMLT